MYTLPDLPYPHDALEPHIDARTMEIHHGRHHNAYVQNLNRALEQGGRIKDAPLVTLLTDLASVPESIRAAVRNNGGGHFNHTFFWTLMGQGKGSHPVGQLGQAMDKTWASFEEFQDLFSKAGVGRFGSGWAWLSLDPQGKLVIHSTPNQDIPQAEGFKPILGLDVWEHAYYLKYQNRRPDYIKAWWNVVDWERANQNYLEVVK